MRQSQGGDDKVLVDIWRPPVFPACLDRRQTAERSLERLLLPLSYGRQASTIPEEVKSQETSPISRQTAHRLLPVRRKASPSRPSFSSHHAVQYRNEAMPSQGIHPLQPPAHAQHGLGLRRTCGATAYWPGPARLQPARCHEHQAPRHAHLEAHAVTGICAQCRRPPHSLHLVLVLPLGRHGLEQLPRWTRPYLDSFRRRSSGKATCLSSRS
jgi:hypothetical protein